MSKENWLDALNDDVRDIRALTLAVQKETKAIREETEQMKVHNRLLEKKVESAWELVIMTREQIQRDIAKEAFLEKMVQTGLIVSLPYCSHLFKIIGI